MSSEYLCTTDPNAIFGPDKRYLEENHIPVVDKTSPTALTALFQEVARQPEPFLVIVEDFPAFLTDLLTRAREAMPNAQIHGFVAPDDALAFIRQNPNVTHIITDYSLGRGKISGVALLESARS